MKKLVALILVILLSSCATKAPQTLYQRLGALPGLERLPLPGGLLADNYHFYRRGTVG